MKRLKTVSILVILVTISAIVAGYSFSSGDTESKDIHAAKNTGFAVVELFTSEGCSSCPSADKTVAKLLSKQVENVYILSYHVDYWNRLGWNDVFSQADFTARQGKYAAFFSLNSVYTPQIVVNGRSEFVGSDERRLMTTVENELRKEAPSNVSVNVKRTNNTVKVTYTTTNQHKALLHLALVQPEATTVVKRGENGGRSLHHVNIVRALHTVDINEKGYLTIEIPKELADIPLQLIAYTQSRKNFAIYGADQTNL
ncbi:MAG: DUF1223 domain-containing protein [Chitinophagaceae bacterium]